MSNFQFINTYIEENIGVIELNRSESLNAINRKMIEEIVTQLEIFDNDDRVRVSIIKGDDRAFAAGADIDEMMNESPISFELSDPFKSWERLTRIKKPIIGSITGFALGGGFELALHCDLIVATEDAKFGFPEVTLGVLPGAGGTQLLTRLIGQRKALEWIWLGEKMPAKVADELGIVNRLVAPELIEEETFRLASRIASKAPISVRLIKEAVGRANDHNLADGMQLERKNFYIAFDSQDQKEGMQAFVDKRPPSFKGE